jgi:hypothetical protein
VIDPIDRWEPWDPHLELTDGPQRVYDDNPEPDPPHQPVGFVIPAHMDEQEPLLWEGDNS